MRLQIGDLVEPTERVTASYSNYGGRPLMAFEPGMIGVVSHVDMQMGGAQVKFFHPATGCMEAARTTKLRKLEWPEGAGLPQDHEAPEWWFCGLLAWRGALHLLNAAAELRPEYFKELHPESLRFFPLHKGYLRTGPDDYPTTDDPGDPRLLEAAQQLNRMIERVAEIKPLANPRQKVR